MLYTVEEKKKMDNVIQAFADYTAASKEFDIAYSDKTGYVRLIVAECADQVFFPLQGFEDLMDMFCMEFVFEGVKKQLENNPSLKNTDVDYDSIRLRLQGYIDAMEEDCKAQAEDVVNRYITNCAINPLVP